MGRIWPSILPQIVEADADTNAVANGDADVLKYVGAIGVKELKGYERVRAVQEWQKNIFMYSLFDFND